MKKIIGIILCITTMLFTASCKEEKKEDILPPENSVKMVATVDEMDEKITVTVSESEYTSGIHWVITSDDTEYFNKDGKAIKKDDIKVGDTVVIYYSGQVMMSYPPQIVAFVIIMN